MSGLNVVALISGGKDSIFSILHCQANGHEVVALANLYPPTNENGETSEDLDSFLYQTVGHAVIPLYEQALGIPLFRQEIVGDAVKQEKDYGPSAPPDQSRQDETESLYVLLKKVKAAIPRVNAVSTGAILSDYQRTRVESVALRLGLTPLSYLWQYPKLPPYQPQSLLEDMGAVGQDARIIKVASGGLDESFLWANAADPRTISRLQRATQRFGTSGDGAVLGEGGEFETLAVAGPAPLWKHCIEVTEDNRHVVSGEAGSAMLRVVNPKVGVQPSIAQSVVALRIPPLLDDEFAEILSKVAHQEETPYPEVVVESGSPADLNIDYTLVGPLLGNGVTAADQTHAIMTDLGQHIGRFGMRYQDIAYTTMILRDMAEFPLVNSAYHQYFAEPNPPARVTIASAAVLPEDNHIMIAVSIVPPAAGPRTGLHVQSRSYWAPANIGPYSQAISVPTQHITEKESRLVYVAGQIPLVPAFMNLTHPLSTEISDIASQAILSLQHAYRIGQQMCVQRWLCSIAFITGHDQDTLTASARTVRRVWRAALEAHRSADEETALPEDFDVWDLRTRSAQANQHESQRVRMNVMYEGEDNTNVPPLVVVHVDSLPRAAMVEWAVYGSTDFRLRSGTIPHFQYLVDTFRDQIVAAQTKYT